MHKRWLRLCFEPRPGTSFEGAEEFRKHADHYLTPLGAEFAGYVAVDAALRRYNGAQPVWQYLLRDFDEDARKSALSLIDGGIPGYRVLAFEKANPGENEAFIG